MSPSRRDFLQTSGWLLVSVGAASIAQAAGLPGQRAAGAAAAGPYPDPDFRTLDAWIVIRPDNTAIFSVGKTDCGQGTGTAFRQMMADELDIAYDKTTCIMGSTDVTVDQGGSGGSDAIGSTAGRCGALRRRHGGCCSGWRPRASTCRSISWRSVKP